MKKRIVSLLAAVLVMCLLCMPLTVSAAKDEKMELTIGSMTAKQGDEIEIPVTLEKNPGIWGFNWDVFYDSQVLRFDKVTFESAFTKDLSFLDNDYMKYPATIQGMAESMTEDVTTTGVVAILHFKVYLDAAVGDSEISIRITDGNNINLNAEDIPYEITNGVITVKEGAKDAKSDNKDDFAPKKPLTEPVRHNTPVGHSGKSAEGGLKWWWFIIGAVILIAVVVVIWLFSGSDEDEENAENAENAAAAEVPVEETPVKQAPAEEEPAEEAPAEEAPAEEEPEE